MRNKKSQTPADAILVIALLVLLAIGGVVAYYITTEIVTAFKADPVMNATPEAVTAYEKAETLNNSWDWLILVVFLGAAMAMIIIGFFIDVHSVFMIIYIIAMFVGVLVSYVLQYVWEQISATAQFATIVVDHFIITNHILSNLTIYYTIVAAISFVATYAKTRGE